MKPLITISTAIAMIASPAFAQEATPPTPQGAEVEPATPAESTGTAKIVQQRADFVVAKVNSNSRVRDPFGMIMDPTNTVENGLADQYAEEEETVVLNNSSLKNALQDLPITGVYPNRQMIVLGARAFSKGGQFGMKLDELTIRLRFEGIKGSEVYFKDMDTQEVATVDFNPKPKEFEAITKDTKNKPRGNGILPMNDLFIVN
ncbi:MAG: hypothetical protein CMO55_21655 [Verrucomicrobiales bacterium]|nr:hypothetical protein [Verrucomicrobiales bacterium]